MNLEKNIEGIVRAAIYQGRHFDAEKDEEVIRRSVEYLMMAFNSFLSGEEEEKKTKRRKWAYGDKYTGRK